MVNADAGASLSAAAPRERYLSLNEQLSPRGAGQPLGRVSGCNR